MAEEPRPPSTEQQPAGGPSPALHRPAGERLPGAAETVSWHRMAGLGVEFIAAVGVFAALGLWADRSFGTSPWLLITGCGIGFTGGLWNMVKAANRMMR